MPMVKNGTTPTETASKPESGTEAAVARLQNSKTEKVSDSTNKKTGYEQQKLAEARGKTRCVQFEAALMSPAIAGMKFKDMKEYLLLVREAADAGVAYSFEEDTK